MNDVCIYKDAYTSSGKAVRLTRDADKEARNKAKHGLDFSFAEIVFADALHVIVYDSHEGWEERWYTSEQSPAACKSYW